VEQALDATSRKSPPALLAAYAVGFSMLHLYANTHGWYYAYPWIDIPMHLGGGIWVAWAAFAYRDRIRGYEALSPVVQALGVICFVALVGVSWELWEAFLDAWRLSASGMALARIPDAFALAPFNDRWDTLLDLVNDLVGATVVAVVWLGSRVARR
jgi:hypothetical protein